MKTINPDKIKNADLVVGIPSYCEKETIGFVAEQASFGLKKYFPDKKSVIVNVDNGSTDDTEKAFLEACLEVPKIYISTDKGVKGKGYNFYNLFWTIKELNAQAGIVLDADLRSVRSNWIEKMGKPIFKGYDFIAPYYMRSKTDATITNHLIYPLTYGLLGWNLRQPIGGDFAFSDKMVDLWLKDKWDPAVYEYGIDVFMSLTAFFQNAKVAQVNLGSKIHNLSNPKLGPMFLQVTETFFKIILANLDKVKKTKKIQRPILFGGKELPILANSNPLKEIFFKTFLDNLDFHWQVIEKSVSKPVLSDLTKIYKSRTEIISLELWLKIVYDFLFAYKQSNYSADIIKALGCLYFGRVASFFNNNGKFTPEEIEAEVTENANLFFENRNYFLSKL
jgi:glucosylglycerate synthase